VQLDAHKSWVTSAGQVDSYVWSSKPLAAEGASTIWLVPAQSSGLSVTAPFDGLGLRGNCSSPIKAEGVIVDRAAMLGPDGGGFEVMLNIVLPYFQFMSAGWCVGLMEAATTKAAAHVGGTYSYSGMSLPTCQQFAHIWRMHQNRHGARADDDADALEWAEPILPRILEEKAAAGEANRSDDLAMRVCGGAAFRKEIGVERNFRDARAATIMAPTTDVLYDFIGKALTGLPVF
jgi:alkylation response protein AidB-like acyl-CoA dehydrogenase